MVSKCWYRPNFLPWQRFFVDVPAVDDIIRQLKSIGALIQGDVTRAFRHVKINPGDYDLLGLEWQGMYMDTLPSIRDASGKPDLPVFE